MPMQRSRRLVGLAVLAFVVGIGLACADTLEDLQPFPCANDGTCPTSYTCVRGSCREGAALEAACTLGAVACAEGDCVGNICVPRCRSDGSGPICDPGRVCSYPPPGESGPLAYCVIDCGSGAPCPRGLTCEPLYGTVKGCISTAAKVSLDRSCDVAEDCSTKYANPTFLPVSCARGTCAQFCSTTTTPPPVRCADPARVCFVGDPILQSGCLVDCSNGQPCPDGQTCKESPTDPAVKMCTASKGDGGGTGGGTGGGGGSGGGGSGGAGGGGGAGSDGGGGK